MTGPVTIEEGGRLVTLLPGEYDPDLIGECDECGERYNVSDQTDHCPEEGLCWDHCTDVAGHRTCDECFHFGAAHVPDLVAPTGWAETRCTECVA